MVRRYLIIVLGAGAFCWGCSTRHAGTQSANSSGESLYIKQDQSAGSIAIFRAGAKQAMLTQMAKPDERPYIHPIVAPDGNGVVTQYRPEHHPHQTGIYWGLKLVNGRDYFMKWQGDYWRRVSASVTREKGQEVKWQTVYDLIDEKGSTTLTETSNWSLQEKEGRYLLDLEWRGEAKTDITFGKFYVGGLFIRMPWQKGTAGEIVNAAGQHNMDIEAQRAIWADVGMEIAGRKDWAHVAIFDHPDNKSFPIAWRTDTQLGLGPSRQILGDWKLNTGETEIVHYRILIYTGNLKPAELTSLWKAFVCER